MKKRKVRQTNIPKWRENKPDRLRKARKSSPLTGLGRYLIGIVLVTVVLRFAGVPVVERIVSHPVFNVRNVVVEGAGYLNEKEIIETAMINTGGNIFEVDVETVSRTLSAAFTAEDFTVFRRLPDTITIRVRERKPVALLNMDSLIGVDADGVPLPHIGADCVESLPIITGIEIASSISNPAVKARLVTGLKLLDRILDDAPAVYSRISEVDVSTMKEMGIMLIDNGLEVIIGDDEWERKIPSLERVISKVTEHIETVKAVDIRYKEKIFVRKKNISGVRNDKRGNQGRP